MICENNRFINVVSYLKYNDQNLPPLPLYIYTTSSLSNQNIFIPIIREKVKIKR